MRSLSPSHMPPEMYYGMYKPGNRWTLDQVPLQDRVAKKTVEVKGAKTVPIKKQKSDFDRRFCTFQIVGRAEHPQKIPLLIIFKGKPSEDDPRVPVSGRLRKEIHLYDKRVIVIWHPTAYLGEGGFDFFYEDFKKRAFACRESENDKILLQMDGYKVCIKKHRRNQYKRDGIKLILSPSQCTDANTSPIDVNVGETLKKHVDGQIDKIRSEDPELNDRIESEGISMLRVEITKWAANAHDKLMKSDIIPNAFKACGLCNDMYGRENHLIGCQNLVSYVAPDRDFVPMKKPFSKEDCKGFYMKEVEMLEDIKEKKKREAEWSRYEKSKKKRKLS